MMRAIDENTITDAVLEQMSSTPDARLKQVMASLVHHLHAFAREVDLTPDEWLAGIRFLTAVGQKCTPFRQEFILFSDTLGVSSLVNALEAALSAIDRGDVSGAKQLMQTFIEKVETQRDAGTLSNAEAATLIDGANAVIAAL